MSLNVIRGMNKLTELANRSKYMNQRVMKFRSIEAEKFRSYAQDELSSMANNPTGETSKGIIARVTPARINIISTGRGTKFIEYGTGIVGENAPKNPMQPSGWDFDVNDHGEKGWHYGAGYRRWTKGQVAKPFMYNTRMYMEQELRKDFKEFFKRYL